jgi:hypothetical protein
MAYDNDKKIGVGSAANDKRGDSLRTAFQKVNSNFEELYTKLGLLTDITLNLGAFEFTGSAISTTDSTPIVIDQSTTITSDLTVGGDIVVDNIKQVASTAGLKQVYFDPATGQLVTVI